MKQVLNGSEIVLECLKEQGVDTVFGYPGGAILNIYDELYKQSDKIHHVLTSHEQGASHAADGYARSYGKSRCLFGYMRSGGNEPCDRTGNRLHGFCSGGGDHLRM